jgi:hypothetical protein
VANFSWFIGVFLGGVTYRWLAREERETAGATSFSSRVATQKSNPSPGRSVSAARSFWHRSCCFHTPLRKHEGRNHDGIPDCDTRCIFDIAQVCDSADAIARHARYLEDGLLFIQNGKILALLPWQEGEQYLDPHKGYTDLRGKLLLPGFVDTHVHYPQTEMIGAFGEQLLEWLTTYTFPVESQFADEAYAKEIAEFFIHQLVSHGTTTALVFCTLHPESVEALFTEALRLNMRLIAGK